MSPRHYLIAGIAFAAFALLVATMRRVPTPLPDAQFYASIARTTELRGIGIPSVLRHSPIAVDHTDFYGPVFFTAVASAFDWFGVSLRSLRAVSLLGALLVVLAGALLAHAVSGRRWRWVWAAALLLLTPEIQRNATAGTMETLAVGLEMLAVAVFVCGLRADRWRAWYAAAAGLLLTLGALTTPRTYPFVAAFFAAGLFFPGMTPDERRQAWRQMGATFGTFAIGIGTWAIVSHGSVLAWMRYMAFILTHEDSDIAMLPTARRQWLFSIGAAVTPLASALSAIAVAALCSRARRAHERVGLAGFALLTGWAAFVGGTVAMNLTFQKTTYIALPLFMAVLAMPYEDLDVHPRALAGAVSTLLAVELGLAVVWYARVAATWEARNPDPVYAFFEQHVPPGSAVIGTYGPYYIAVERAGSRYRSISSRSWADWARWVPLIEPEAVAEAMNVPITITRERFFIWRPDDALPPPYGCVRGHEVATFQPAPTHLGVLGWLGSRTWDTGYPPIVLYRLPDGCPTGYDPTR